MPSITNAAIYFGKYQMDIGAGIRVSENCAFMGMFQKVSGVHYDASSNTLFAGNMTNGGRNVTSGDVYQLAPGKSCLLSHSAQIIVPY